MKKFPTMLLLITGMLLTSHVNADTSSTSQTSLDSSGTALVPVWQVSQQLITAPPVEAITTPSTQTKQSKTVATSSQHDFSASNAQHNNSSVTPTTGNAKVRALQEQLSADGYYAGPINGIMTPETRQAAKGALQDRL